MPDNPSISDPTASTKQFSSRYELNHKLGAGGMGVVYKGYDKVLSKQVAVKLLLPSLKKEAAIRFQKEARAAAKLDHLNILKVLDFGQTETGELYLIMDFIEGESLSDLIKRQGPLDVNLAVDIFLQLSSGLEHAHRNSVLHRDVKPSNVMLVKSPGGGYICKIVDFGLAKLDSEEQKLTATGARIGSPMYMSPEQARGEEVDLRSDIYSLGCLMYMTLKGKPPFLGDSYMETIAMQIEQPAPKLNDGLSSQRFPTALEEIVDKTLQKEPTKRFQSMEELRQALQEFSEHH